MAFLLKGIVQGMRVVGNKEDEEHAAGEKWRFLSLEIADARSGVHSCQLSDRNPQYKEFVGKDHELVSDLTGHKVKAIIQSVQPGTIEVKDKEGRVLKDDQGKPVKEPIVRIRIASLKDEGMPNDDE